MATYYVGPGGNNSNAGTSWATRKLTLNGAEDIPVAAGDTVYVGPGTYRELLTCDISGSSGSPITYIADITGAYTDGVGGPVRVTGSDDDVTMTRTYCVNLNGKQYRTFRGFVFDLVTDALIYSSATTACSGLVITDCVFMDGVYNTNEYGIYLYCGDGTTTDIERCVFAGLGWAVYANHPTTSYTADISITDSLFIGCRTGVYSSRPGGISVSQCTFVGCYYGVYTATTVPTGGVTVNNSIITGCYYGLGAGASGDLVENYNSLFANNTDRSNVTAGSNSDARPALFSPPVLYSGITYPVPLPGMLSPWSTVRAITGTSPTSADLYGLPRPSTAAKVSRGAVQYQPVVRETGTTYNSSTASLKLGDAGVAQFRVPVDGTQITVSVRVYRESSYAGTAPQMVIRQPGRSARTTTDTGSSGSWNQLTDTFTPASSPPYIIVELVSNNTASSGSYAVYFDALVVN